MINRLKTIKDFGYDPNTLSNGSNKRIYRVCDKCKNEKIIMFKQYRNLCQICSNKLKNRMKKEKLINLFVKNHTNNHLCQCGCGEEIEIRRNYYSTGIPKFIHGHNKQFWNLERRLKSTGINNSNYNLQIDQFIKENQEKYFCECGCGREIIIEKRYYSTGIPKFIHGHNSKGKNHWNWQGGITYKTYSKEFYNIRKQIRSNYNNCDYISGIHKDTCSPDRELDIHHVDYDKKNNKIDNFIPLSRNNHTKTGINRPFWNRLFIYALKYDKTYYGDDY